MRVDPVFPRHVLKRLGILLLVALALTGCSQFKVLYAFGGEAIRGEAEFFLDLTEAEEAALAENVDVLVRWHRMEMLPKYAAFLSMTADRVENGSLHTPDVKETIIRMRSLLKETVEGASPIVAGVLADHTTPQKVAHLSERMRERLAERRAEMEGDWEEWTVERTERAVDRFERFMGHVTPAQEKIIQRYFEGISDMSARWQQMREIRHQAFVDFLVERPDRESIARFLPGILLRSGEVVGPVYTQLADSWWRGFTGWMVEMAGSMTPEQRMHLARTLRGYAEDMVDLST